MYFQLETLETKEVPEVRKKANELGKEIEALRENLDDVSVLRSSIHF